MNKKLLTICLVIVLILTAVCFVSCKENASDKLRKINTALMREYSKVELTVATTSDEVTLDAKYVLTYSDGITNISFEVDRLNSFDTEGEIPTEFKSTIKGNAVYDGNKITSVDGGAVDYDVPLDVVSAHMMFKVSYLGNIRVHNNGIFANVTNPQAFLGDDEFEGTDMTVRVVLDGANLSSIVINYQTDNDKVKLQYSFAR